MKSDLNNRSNLPCDSQMLAGFFLMYMHWNQLEIYLFIDMAAIGQVKDLKWSHDFMGHWMKSTVLDI